MKKLSLVFFVLFVCIQLKVGAQPAERLIKVQVAPDHPDWLYRPGEKVTFRVSVFRCGVPLEQINVRYEISEDMMPPHLTGTRTLKNGKLEIAAGTMEQNGFLRCCVFATWQGHTYEGVATAGFSPEKLQPVTALPADFLDFWEANKAAARKYPLDPVITLLPEKCTAQVNVYHVSFQNDDYASRIYGMLCVPKAPGKYPAILKVPGAGIRAYNGDPERAGAGFVILEIGVHGIPVNLPGVVYSDLSRGALKNYPSFNLGHRDTYYYKRIYTGCVRAVDFIYSLPQFDGNLATFGGSQGGALSIVTAALDKRVKGLVAMYPALCDMAGYAHGRAGGWPHMFKDEKNRTPEKLRTASYYDVVNFARQVKAPGFYTFGYNDRVCPPTTTYSAFNEIEAPKELYVAENTAHYAYAEQWDAAWNWITDFLKKEAEKGSAQ